LYSFEPLISNLIYPDGTNILLKENKQPKRDGNVFKRGQRKNKKMADLVVHVLLKWICPSVDFTSLLKQRHGLVEPKATAGSQRKGSVDRSATIVQMI
jgi:hypothetical protein